MVQQYTHYIFQAVQHQVYVNTVLNLIGIVLAIGLYVSNIYLFKRYKENIKTQFYTSEDDSIGFLIAITIGVNCVAGLILFLVCVPEFLSLLLNPDYHVLELLKRMIQF